MHTTSTLPKHNIHDKIKDYALYMSLWFNKRYQSYNKINPFSFESNIWYLRRAYKNTEQRILDFNCFNEIEYNKVDKVLIKCYLANLLIDGYAEDTVALYYSILKVFYDTSNGMNLINTLSEEEIKLICTQGENIYLYIPTNYIDFLLENQFYDMNYEILLKAKNRLDSMNQLVNRQVINRDLPSNTDIAQFQYYLNYFEINEEDIDLKNLFYPLIIWWRLSIMIPMRPSEITYNLKKDCIYKLNNACYIRINRIKGNLINRYQIPIIKKICISDELYNLILNYQELVEFDTKSKSLFSMHFLRNCFQNVKTKYDFFRSRPHTFLRYYDEYSHFESGDLNQLIDLFYDYYIDNQINSYKYSDRLRAGDTRHIAFSSLLLQNLNPIDIAMIGGHTSLASLSSYVYHVDLYIDSEIYRYYNKIDLHPNDFNKSLKNTVMNMPNTPPHNIEDAIPDEYNIGFCMDNSFQCEDDLCFFCSRWWCRPKNDNYIQAAEYIIKHNMSLLQTEMNSNKKMLHVLLNKASIEIINNTMILKEEYYSHYRQLIKSIAGNATRMEMLKNALYLNFSSQGDEIEDE